ncbi:hypothetical protein DLJ53_12925 [Acuticoccus sediminis]|uniref:Tripartite-type tricarboxylate transporter receptor subunit TctC n=1 Tax=Acuticoccus sediminis TaxID=2184697 RepID=A0A8B2NTI4_9HYPH|nr:tripartite tricarboxylate transporter substrate binding protein [Acuticoccus sediminis]RAI02261.1 hypothetical protein DLJ53_12925 [Acuticoccus sediminis]
MLKSSRRLIAATLTALGVAMASQAHAEYPDKPITLIIPFQAGGSTETLGRVFAEALGKQLGGRVVVKTRPGAGGAIGATELAFSEPDGYTLMMASSSVLLWPPLAQDVDYDKDDFTPIAQIAETQQAIVAAADAPFDTFKELVAYSKDHDLSYADQGAITRVFIDYLASQEGVTWTAIPTKGGGEAMPFLLGGKVDFSYSGGVHSRYGDKMKVLMSLIGKPLVSAPDAPVILDDYGIALPSESLIAGPAGMDPEIVARLESAIEAATMDEAFVDMSENKLMFPVVYSDSATLSASLDKNNEGLKKVLEAVQ